jgi:sortase A
VSVPRRHGPALVATIAPAPGHAGLVATRSAIVLSTCATQEDNAAGLTYRDSNHNPAHRIAAVGYLSKVERL